jgi:hypothetical protein
MYLFYSKFSSVGIIGSGVTSVTSSIGLGSIGEEFQTF